MVSADNLNLDVLELIFSHLTDNDLVHVALVSRSFLAGIIPRLYCNIFFKLYHSARYNRMPSPFAVLKAHPDLAIHVRRIEILAVPFIKSQVHPNFLVDCASALQACKNLNTLICLPKVMAPLLKSIQGKERLENIRLYASLTTEQSEELVKVDTVRSITLDSASWNILDQLEKWAFTAQRNLTTLTLYMAQDLNESVLERTLSHLPNLTGLHIIGCVKITHNIVLKLATRTHALEELSFTIFDNSPMHRPPLPHLRHLALDIRAGDNPSTVIKLTTMLTNFRPYTPPLASITMKFSDRQLVVWDTFIQVLLESYGSSLVHLAFLECTVANDSIRQICESCPQLERLEAAIPLKDDFRSFTSALSTSSTLKTLVDIGDSHTDHGPRPTLSRDNVRHLMNGTKKLRQIISNNRVWTGRGASGLSLTLQRRKPSSSTHWFHPHA